MKSKTEDLRKALNDNAKLYQVNQNLERKCNEYFEQWQYERKQAEKWKEEYLKILQELTRREKREQTSSI